MGQHDISIENVCTACSRGPCGQPCELWYDVLAGKSVTLDVLGGAV